MCSHKILIRRAGTFKAIFLTWTHLKCFYLQICWSHNFQAETSSSRTSDVTETKVSRECFWMKFEFQFILKLNNYSSLLIDLFLSIIIVSNVHYRLIYTSIKYAGLRRTLIFSHLSMSKDFQWTYKYVSLYEKNV